MSTYQRALWGLLLVALLGAASGALVRPGGAAWGYVYDVGLYNAVYLSGALLCWRAGRRALGAALLVNVCGNALYSLVVVRMDPEPYPSVADVFYLSTYLLLYVAVLRAVRGRVRRLQTSMWLDGAVAALGTGAVAMAFLLGPLLSMSGENAAAVAVNLAYPLADLVLLLLLAASAAVLGLRADRSLSALAAGLLVYLVADVGYLSQVSQDAYVEGGWLDQGWLLGTALLALSTATPPCRETAPSGGVRLGWQVLALPIGCSLASGVVLAVGYGSRLPPVAAWFALGCWAVGLLRTGLTFREIRDLQGARLQARTDELTGLPNRRAVYEAWQAPRAGEEPASLVLFDLDGFKDVNDSLGHHAGDAVLVQVAARLSEVVGTARGWVPARLGGDEFAVVLPGAAADAQVLVQSLQRALAAPFDADGVRLHVGASFGVAAGLFGAGSLSEVLRQADVAMYHAKRSRSGSATYVDDLGAGMADRLRTVEELRLGLDRDELLVHLQPQVRPGDGRLCGVEALVRWQHPRRGLLAPGELLPAAEQAGLMGPLAERVLDLAMEAAAVWWERDPVPVSVNLSAANVTDLDLPDKVSALLRHHRLPAAALVLELVEDTLMQDPERAQAVLRTFRERGIAVSIDDYGTGYSSLAYLKDLPADELKIDRVFVADVLTHSAVRAIVEHTVSLAHVLGLRVVAEGVEDGETLALLAALGCDAAQGFHIARPMPLADFLAHVDVEAERALAGHR